MEYRKIGKSDVEVSEVSLGCWTLGGLNWVDGVPNGWANVDENEAIGAIHWALDQGVNHFDNADVYGNGRAERLLAKALGEKSTEVVIATKVGHFRGTAEHAYDGVHVRHQCEQSLKNLHRDYVDIYYFHHGDFGQNDQYLDEALEAAHRLREEGKIRLIGLSAYSDADFARLVPKIVPDVLQSWAHALQDGFIRKGGVVNGLLEQYGMSFVAFSPLAQGVLLGKYDPENPPTFEEGDHRRGSQAFSRERLLELQPKIDALRTRFGSEVRDLARIALQYVLHEPRVCCVIPGFRNQKQVETNVAAAGKPLSPEDIDYIRDVLGTA